MAKAITSNSETNMTMGFAHLGEYQNKPGSPESQVHDGDTLNVKAAGNFGIRFLGIDTPEVSFSLPGASFLGLNKPKWQEFLADPLNDKFGVMKKIPEGLFHWLKTRTGPDAAAIHYEHAQFAKETLIEEIKRDQKVMQQDDASFRFFMVFGFEVMDGYGRLLCLINRNQPNRTKPTPRPPTYNLRLMERGRAWPYFIWPNINPWDKPDSIMDAVLKPNQAKSQMEDNEEISKARLAIEKARTNHLGVFDAMRPALLESFELRNLARRSGPSRYLIDLTKNDNVLLHPLNYYTVPNSEDRLWIPSTYVPLFVDHGWQKQASPV